MVTELPGRTSAYESSDVRPQVNGVIRRRFFTEGSLVRRGQPLYEIDPRLYRAAVNQAQANLASARANQEALTIQADRYKPLAAIEAVSKQEYTNAIASARQATASVAQTRAALDTARVNLQFTTVPAPISGRIGRSLFTVGALVSASQTDPLAQIQRLDPIFVDIQQSAADLLSLRRKLMQGGVAPTRAEVKLLLEDGSDYGYTGTVEFAEALATIQRLDPVYVDIQQSSADLLKLRQQIMDGQLLRDGNAPVKLTLEDGTAYGPQGTLRFADVTVDPTTGSQVIRALFPNPNGLLLPGMFVRASLVQGIKQNGMLVPQRAVTRDEKGQATAMVIGADGKVQPRSLQTTRTIGDNWLVTGGLKPGDKVIVEGGMMLRPGMPVKGEPWNPNAKPAGGPQGQPQAQGQAK